LKLNPKRQINQFDGGAGAGGGSDGNLMLLTLPVDGNAANNRVTGMEYDWRNRQAQVNSSQDDYVVNTFDTLDRVVRADRHAQASGNLIGRAAVNYDDRGRAYQNIRFAVDPATGTVGNALVDNMWYDPSSNVLMSLPAGSSAFSKSVFDALSRQTVEYVGYHAGPISYAQAVSVTGLCRSPKLTRLCSSKLTHYLERKRCSSFK